MKLRKEDCLAHRSLISIARQPLYVRSFLLRFVKQHSLLSGLADNEPGDSP